jgi:hypothetical protein
LSSYYQRRHPVPEGIAVTYSYDVDMSKSYFAGEDGHPFDSDDDGNLFSDTGREEEYDSGAELSTRLVLVMKISRSTTATMTSGEIEAIHSSEHLRMCLGRGGR